MRILTRKSIGGLAAVGVALSTSAWAGSAGTERTQVAQACGWYAIFQCAKTPNLGGPGYVIVTNNFPNFRPGWYCKVLGPYGSHGEAAAVARQGGGYAKSAC